MDKNCLKIDFLAEMNTSKYYNFVIVSNLNDTLN